MRILVLLIALFYVTLVGAEVRTPVIAVIVSSQDQADKLKLSPSALKLIYLRKQLYWPNGKRLVPVNLHAEHPLRNQFSQSVLGSLPKQQIDYWNGLYFNGIQPPHSVNSEEAVLRFITDTKGAIGYVNACTVDDRVKVLLWIEGDHISTQPITLDCSP
jgi:ABC-type phosphate transport system substrate-binding protein